MVRIEFIERVHFVSAEKFQVLSSTSIAKQHTEEIENYIRSVMNPNEDSFNHIIEKIEALKPGQMFSISKAGRCKYIRCTE